MTPQEQEQFVALSSLQCNVTPVQVGNEIKVLVQIAAAIGVTNQYVLDIGAARSVWRTIKEGVEKAEQTLVKPQSGLVANA